MTFKKGFSLLELLIVIMILSLVYMLGFRSIDFSSTPTKALTPLNLKSIITSSAFFKGEGTFMCLDKCRSCYFRKNIQSPFEPYESPLDLTQIEAYTLDENDDLTPIEYGRYDDKKICLILDFYPNGSSTQLVLNDQTSSYFLPAFFGEPQAFETIEEAQAYWLRNTKSVSDTGGYY